MLVAEPGEAPALLDFFVAAPGDGRGHGGARAAARRPRCSSRPPPRSSTSARASCGAYGTPAGICEAHRRFATLPLADLVAPGAGARARRASRSTRSRPTSSRCSSRSSPSSRRRARSTGSATAWRARATCCPTPSSPTRSSGSGAEGAAPFYTGDIAAAACRAVRARRRHADARRPRGLRGDRARADPRRLPRPRRLHQPAAVGGRHPDRLVLAQLEREPGPPSRRGCWRRWSRRSARARRSSSRAWAARLPRGVLASQLGSTTHISVLDGDGLGLLGDVHQRRGLGRRRPRHRHPPQQHDGRGGPLAARASSPTRPAAACRR